MLGSFQHTFKSNRTATLESTSDFNSKYKITFLSFFLLMLFVPAVEPAEVEEVGRDATGEAAGDCSSGTMGDSSGSSPDAT